MEGQRRLLLAGFATSLPRPSLIATPDIARYLITRSEGAIDELAHLLMAAAIAAVKSGEEAIPDAELPAAWLLAGVLLENIWAVSQVGEHRPFTSRS